MTKKAKHVASAEREWLWEAVRAYGWKGAGLAKEVPRKTGGLTLKRCYFSDCGAVVSDAHCESCYRRAHSEPYINWRIINSNFGAIVAPLS